MGHLLTWGNGYSFIEHGGDGRVKALHLMKPDRTIPRRLESGILVYDYIDDRGRTHRYLRDQILHVPALGYDGVVGYSPIRMAAETIGTGIAAAQFAGRFFANGAVPGGVLEHPEKLSQEGHDRLRTDWERLHTGGENAHRVAILEEGMKYQRITINPVDAQLLESLRFSRQEIAGIYRVPAHFINDLEHATFSNIEQLGLEFVQFSLAPWLTRFENSMNRRLFLPSERGRYFVEFVVDGLLRGDVQSRNNANRTAIMGGWKSPNEVRAQENLPPFEGGDNYFMQGAMMTVENIIDQQAPNTGGGVENGSEGKAGSGGNGAPRDSG
jgi:HK97 family phage portal protein